MKPRPKHLLIAMLLAALNAGAGAHPSAPAPAGSQAPAQDAAPAPRHQAAPGQTRRAERHGQRLAALQERLQLSPAQQEAWQRFARAMQPPARRPQGPSRAELARLSTPERIDHLLAMQAERQARLRQRADAVKAFYAQLTPEQRQTFDAQHAQRFGPKAKRREKGHDSRPGTRGHPRQACGQGQHGHRHEGGQARH